MNGKKIKKKNNITLGDSYVSFSPYYKADSIMKSMPEEYPFLEVKGDKNKMNLRFERFEESLEWDPIFQLNESDEDILPSDEDLDLPSHFWIYVIFVVLVIIIASVVGYCFLSRKRKKNTAATDYGLIKDAKPLFNA